MKHPISTYHPRKALEAAEQAVIEAATSTRQTSSALMMESRTGAKIKGKSSSKSVFLSDQPPVKSVSLKRNNKRFREIVLGEWSWERAGTARSPSFVRCTDPRWCKMSEPSALGLPHAMAADVVCFPLRKWKNMWGVVAALSRWRFSPSQRYPLMSCTRYIRLKIREWSEEKNPSNSTNPSLSLSSWPSTGKQRCTWRSSCGGCG